MDSLGDQLLPGATFTLDQNTNICPRYVFDNRLDSAQLRIVREENLINSLHHTLPKEQSMCQGDIKSKDMINPLKSQGLARLCLTDQAFLLLSNREKGEKIGEKVERRFHCRSNELSCHDLSPATLEPAERPEGSSLV